VDFTVLLLPFIQFVCSRRFVFEVCWRSWVELGLRDLRDLIEVLGFWILEFGVWGLVEFFKYEIRLYK
jgi:hypothetical protein